MLEIKTTCGPQGSITHHGEAMGCSLKALPAEVLVEVMTHLPDMAALSRFFTAYPLSFFHFQPVPVSNRILNSIMNKMSPELRHPALTVLAVRSRVPIDPSHVTTRFIEHHREADVYDAQLRLGSYEPSALLDLTTIAESIESLTESFARDRVLGPSMQHNMPLSPTESHRIRRAFWGFQLCYDMCHPEDTTSSRGNYEVKSRSTRRYVQYQINQPNSKNVPNWLKCRGEKYRPKFLSRYLPKLSRWEHEELEAIRFHLTAEVNRVQFHRSCGSDDKLFREPVLLQRLIRDIDHWDPAISEDHILVTALRQTRYARHEPVVWDRFHHLYDASFPNTSHRLQIQVFQEGNPQWGWCLWDETRLEQRGLFDVVYEKLLSVWKGDDEVQTARIRERRGVLGRTHAECVSAQYTVLDRRIAVQFDLDARLHAERLRWDSIWEFGPEGREWMPTDLDRVYGC